MSSLKTWRIGDTALLWNKVKPDVEAASSVSGVMQTLTGVFYETYVESLVLARAFLTVPFEMLPTKRQAFVRALLDGDDNLAQDTPVLSLLGTRGADPLWNSVDDSQGHLGIPLISNEFVARIPMVSRLLTDLEIGIDLGADQGTTYRDDPTDRVRTFYVEDAQTDRDEQGRKVIVNQEFVKQFGVKSVFGVGGPYPDASEHLLAVIFFATERISLDLARAFDPLLSEVQDASQGLLLDRNIF